MTNEFSARLGRGGLFVSAIGRNSVQSRQALVERFPVDTEDSGLASPD